MPATKSLDLSSKIKGWGVDAEPSSRPGVPREKAPARRAGVHWDKIPSQESHYRVNWSTERPGPTPIFGTSCPPKLLSGLMRSIAYRKFSEGRLAHWLLLLAADRVDMVEELILDPFRGRLPRPFKEMGLDEEFSDADTRIKRGFKKGTIPISVGVVGTLAVAGLIAGKRRRHSRSTARSSVAH